MVLETTLFRKQYGCSLNINIDLPYDPAMPLVGVYPKE
jgi:phage baseplate assembly protein W